MKEFKSRLAAHKKKLGMGAVLLAAVLAAVWGGKMPGSHENQTAKTAETAEMKETEETKARLPLPVDEEEEALLKALYQAMEKKEMDRAAEIINREEEGLKTLVQETLAGKKYLYRMEEEEGESIGCMEEITKETEGKGLAVTRFNTIFFGDFSGGKPEGDCAAVQAMVLTEPRFTYADGEWKDGKMNGHGKTGYRYYENPPETGFVMAEKEGMYQENLLEGAFTYTAENAEGERLLWSMQAEQGVTVLSGKWTFYESNGTYMLPSEKDPGRAYVLSENQAQTVMWNNLITWDEQ